VGYVQAEAPLFWRVHVRSFPSGCLASVP
jgi:hypothetical protein